MIKNGFIPNKQGWLNLLKRSKESLKFAANALLPQQCVLCQASIDNAPELLICEHCESSLTRIDIACAICSTPMHLNENTDEGICGVCLKTDRQWSSCVTAYQYCEPISSLIHQFKYQHETRLRHTLCNAFIENIQFQESLPDILVPVPMHYSRLAFRGYDHSAILAKTLSDALDIPVVHAITKSQRTPSLARLSSKERAKHIKNSFQLNPKIRKNLLIDKHVAIIDDVVTTGTTSSEVARVLQEAEPTDISVWCIART